MKTVICGLWHVHAEGYYQRAKALGEVAGVWDDQPRRLEAFCEKYGEKAFSSLDELIDSDAENVIVCTATEDHADVIVRLANAGKNIFTEKVLALSDEDCSRVAEAVERNHVKFVISLPHKYTAMAQTVKRIADSGELGKLNYLRYRNCHSGSVDQWLPAHFYNRKQCGGGAMIDLGAHGMYMTDWLLGLPEGYSSAFTFCCTREKTLNQDRVEDNAVTMMTYPDGCIAINETGFVSRGCPMTLELGGEKGYLRMDDRGIVKSTEATGYRSVAQELCPEQTPPIDQFLTGQILEGCGIREAIRLTHMMVCAYQKKI